MSRLALALRVVVMIALIGAILFGAAGRIDLPFFWGYLALLLLLGLGAMFTLSPELLEERRKPGAEGRDNLNLLRVVAGLMFVSQWIIAGLDVGRYHWSDSIPAAFRALGLVGFALVFAVWYWAMRTNPFFSSAVRIQRDRGHHVVDTGPYRYVRHPGYAAFVLLGWGGPVALGSWWAVLTHVAVIVLFVRRALIEDRMLQSELEGYAAYAGRVRWRFLPGIF